MIKAIAITMMGLMAFTAKAQSPEWTVNGRNYLAANYVSVTGGVMSGNLTLNYAGGGTLFLAPPTQEWLGSGHVQGTYFYQHAGNWSTGVRVGGNIVSLRSDLGLWLAQSNNTYGKLWTSFNHGSGSGLDADTLDGISADAFVSSTNYPFFYALQFEHGAVSPEDETLYFIGGVSDLPPTTIQEASRTIFTHASGFIRKVSIHHSVGGNIASDESSTLKVVNLTQTSESVITQSKQYTNAHQAVNYELATPMAVASGDALTIVWEAPAWTINPTSVRNNFVVTVER